MSTFTFGTVSAPDGKLGPWRISTFSLREEDVLLNNLRYIRDDKAYMVCPPGTYRRLTHDKRGVIMSNTPMETLTAQEAVDSARGNVLVNGLGLGMVIEAMLHKDEVRRITVVELDKHVLKLVGPTVTGVAHALGKELSLVHADAEAYEPPAGERYDYVWHDIWDQIDDDNLPQMKRLMDKYRHIAKKQACWSRPQALALKREMGRITCIG